MKVERVIFKSGQAPDSLPLTVLPKRITLLIGPNNGGKSKALAELQEAISPITEYRSLVIESVIVSEISEAEFREKISQLVKPKRQGESASADIAIFEARGARQQVYMSMLKEGIKVDASISQRQYLSEQLLKYFYVNLGGMGRLDLANPVQIQPVGSSPANTISAVWNNDKIRAHLSLIVYRAFAQYLVIDPTQAPQVGYKLSPDPAVDNFEKRFDPEANSFFAKAMPLQTASDGTKAFVGLVAEVMAGNPDIVFIDEPEAFLHPSLQFLLGQQISIQTSGDKQVFAATHSSAFLLGCVLSGVDVDVIRLTYRGGVSSARHLGAVSLKKLMTDPLFRSVGASTALFYETAVVVEGDSDRAFYDEVNSRMVRFSENGINHTIFLNAHNKQTVVNIVSPLRGIGIPTPFILDIDWIKEDGQVWDRYFTATGAPTGLKSSLAAARSTVRSYLQAKSPEYKRNGGIDLLSGQELETANSFFDQMEEYGLFTVRSGELESWLKDLNVERTKNKWLISIFEAMGSDPDDEAYLKPSTNDVWGMMGRLGEWANNAIRKGM